ncbi:unnamed protein product [Rotaria sordida]|uniref:TTF-type domain-containing protein n=1 Tax=Rotaria sordida TaxID=392033 RepID=A0A813VGA7_9BILA|nr:unnamed protein product [Rotaria sordida]
MDSNLPSSKRNKRSKDGHDILKYFKKKKADDTTSTICSSAVTSNSSISNEQSNVAVSVENKEELTTAEVVFESEVSTQANNDIIITESDIEDEPAPSNSSSVRQTTTPTTTMMECSTDKTFVDEIGVQLRIIETLFESCQKLIKSSTSIDICPEIFVEQSNVFAEKIVQYGTDLKNLCTSFISMIETNRNNIIVTNPKQDKLIDRDPGSYNSNYKFTEEELRYFASVGPLQIKLDHYPRNEELYTTGKTCRFATKWYEEHSYLEYSEKKDAAFCFTCRLFTDGPGSEKHADAWTSNGVRKLEQHFSSIAHVASVNRYLNFKTKKLNVDLMLDNNRRKENQEQEKILQLNKEVIVTLLDSARFLAAQGLAFRREPENEGNFIQLIQLQRRNNHILNDWFLKAKLDKYQVSYLSHRSQDDIKRYHVLREQLDKSPYGLSVKSLSGTRWSANYESIHSVIESYDIILQCLILVEEETNFDKETMLKGRALKNKLMSYEIFVLLKFLENITRTTHSLTKHLQSKELDILSSIDLIDSTLKLIKIMRNDDQSLINILICGEEHGKLYDVDIEKEFDRLHRPRQRSCRFDSKPETAVRLTRQSFYLKLFREILDHLYTTYADYLKVLKEKLKWFNNITPDRIEQLTLAECEHMCAIVPNLISAQLLYTEFQLLTDKIKECDDMSQVIRLLQQSGHLYPKLSKVYNFILTLPISIAKHLSLCSVERDLIEKLNLSKLSNDWDVYISW